MMATTAFYDLSPIPSTIVKTAFYDHTVWLYANNIHACISQRSIYDMYLCLLRPVYANIFFIYIVAFYDLYIV